ncbi:MAG: DUF2442 domain-containing protein [Betaproteobacteria bacterium]|jgi:hypothetical protein|nr:DUF2442 domain-containing protein [Betaproteobacteria bacterium]
MEPDVVDVQVLPAWALWVKFSDGISGKVQFHTSHLTGVFEALLDQNVFQQAHIESGAVTWPGQIDLAPDAMYKAIKSQGEWILR